MSNLENAINQVNTPIRQLQETLTRMMEPSRIIRQQTEIIQSTIDNQMKQYYASQQSIQRVIQAIPVDFFANIQKSVTQFPNSIALSFDTLRKSIPFEQIAQLDLSFLDDLNPEEIELDEISLTEELQEYIEQEVTAQVQSQSLTTNTSNEWQQFILKLYRNLPITLFLMFISFLTSPLQEYVLEEPRSIVQEYWEDKLNIDITGETVAMIREDAYLRAGRSKHAPVVLQAPLKKSQSVLRIIRKKNWVKVSVLIENETYEGWVEKSKVIQP